MYLRKGKSFLYISGVRKPVTNILHLKPSYPQSDKPGCGQDGSFFINDTIIKIHHNTNKYKANRKYHEKKRTPVFTITVLFNLRNHLFRISILFICIYKKYMDKQYIFYTPKTEIQSEESQKQQHYQDKMRKKCICIL